MRRGSAPALMARVAYLNGRTYRGEAIGRSDVPQLEIPDRELIVAAGRERGIAFETVYWDEPDIAAQGFDLALIRTCWDYTNRAEEFAATLEAHERAGLLVCNSSAVVRWNARKTYLKELGPAAIETVWLDQADARGVAQAFDALDAAEIVVKPQVGAGSVGTVRLKRNGWSEADLIDGPRGPTMIQPYLRSIETEGERSLFWFGGRRSHAIRKLPDPGEWLANRPGKTRVFSEQPPPAALETAEAARASAPGDLLYVRIDLVLGEDGRWRVIEIEAIEPYLFLPFAPEGAPLLIEAIARVLGV
jgi:glutathione synthase/RimK-type ligase-like ATP-grasp enzyme